MTKVRRNRYYFAAVIAFLAFAVYLSALQNDFLNWDDNLYIVENPIIRSFNANLFRAAFFQFTASNWHPLTWISHALDYAVWGLNPLGHHLTSILLHAVNTFLVVFLVIRLLEAAKARTNDARLVEFLSDRTVLIAAGVAGLLFGLHPVHVESVAWVAERKDLLCGLFFLLSITMYVKYGTVQDDTASRYLDKRYLSSLGFFVLALLSKPMAVSLPVVLLILDWYPLNRIRTTRSFRAALAEKLPFAALSFASSVLTVLAQRTEGALVSFEAEPLSTRLLVAAQSLIAYLRNMMLPLNLLPFYPYPKHMSTVSLVSVIAILLIISITVLCVWYAKQQKVWLSVWACYVTTLIPVLGIVQVGGQAMADRYTYLPSIGPFLIIGLLTARIWRTLSEARRWGSWLKPAGAAAAFVFFVSLSLLTTKQISIWKNNFVFWSFIIKQEPARVPLAYNNRGIAYKDIGRVDMAMQDFNQALTINPSYADAYYNRGRTLEETGQRDKALADYEKSIALNPQNYLAYNNLGVLYGREGSYQKSIEYFSKAIAVNRTQPEYYFNRGLSYASVGRFEGAMADFSVAIDLNNNFSAAYYNRATLLLKTGRSELALKDMRKACDLGVGDACSALQALSVDTMQRREN